MKQLATLTNDLPARANDQASLPDPAVQVLRRLRLDGYRFVTPTPLTHRRLLRRRPHAMAQDVRDVLGWSLPFSREVLPPALFRLLQDANLLTARPEGYRSKVRISSLGDDLFMHSAYPPSAEDAVFFGPDTYRFANFVEQELADSQRVGRLVEIGVGSGAGLAVAAKATGAAHLIGLDINREALRMARINLAAAGIEADLRLGSGLDNLPEPADLIIANPPYIAGSGGRTYRDGGDMHGARLSLDWALQGATKLTPGGRFLLYTGSAIVNGVDGLREALVERLDADAFSLAYSELDPDIFGEQLSAKGYEDVERIAAIGAVITRTASE